LFSETDVLVVSPRDFCPKEVLAAAPRLRAVVSAVIGVDTIDMDAANNMGLIVGHGAMPENYLGVSESTVMLIAALLLDLRGKETILRANAPRPAQLKARMVRGKTIGLIGIGRTARGVVERLRGWDVYTGLRSICYSRASPNRRHYGRSRHALAHQRCGQRARHTDQ
jgi:D-3-phosphoglycerate dehydrogenase